MPLLGFSEQAVKYRSDNPRDPRVQLMVVATKPAPLPYPVTPEWCERVRDALKSMGRGAQSRLADYLKVRTGLLSETLDGVYQTSTLVEPIHRFFGWSPPLPPTASLDVGELVHGFQRMTPAQREFLDEAREVLEGASGDQARKALMEMLKVFKAASPKND